MKQVLRVILVVVGILIAIVLLIDFNRRLEALNSLSENLVSVRAEGTAVMQTQQALVTQVAYATSDNSVEQWAYENKWVRSGEHPVVLVGAPGGVTPTPEPQVLTPTESLPNWRIWWELFFGAN